MITREKALEIAEEYLRNLSPEKAGIYTFNTYEKIRDGDRWEEDGKWALARPQIDRKIPTRCPDVMHPTDGYWVVYLHDTRFSVEWLHSSTIIAVNKETGAVDYFGSAADEG